MQLKNDQTLCNWIHDRTACLYPHQPVLCASLLGLRPATVFERDACADDIARAAWPFPFYERGGFIYRFEFNPPFLLLDLVLGRILAVVLGWFIARTKSAPD